MPAARSVVLACLLALLAAAAPAAGATLTGVTLDSDANPQEVAFDGAGVAWVSGKSFPQNRPALFKVSPLGTVERILLDTVRRNKAQGVLYASWDRAIYVCVPSDATTQTFRPAEIIRVPLDMGATDPPSRLTRFGIPTAAQPDAAGCWDLADAPPLRRVYFSGRGAETVGFISPDTPGVVTTMAVPAAGADTLRRPHGITLGPDGNVWFTLYNADAVGRAAPSLDPATYVRIPLPGDATSGGPAEVEPRDIVPWSDGRLWVTAHRSSQLLAITTDGSVQAVPLGDVVPNRISVGGDGNLWFADETSRVARFSPDGRLALYPLPTGSNPRGSAAGPGGTMWMVGEGTGTLYGLPLDLGPAVSGIAASGAANGSVTITYDVDARGVGSATSVDLGPTAAYGATAGPLDAGGFDGPARREVGFGGLAPGTYHFRVRASNPFGDRQTGDQTVVVPPPPAPPPVDADGDGIPAGVDCDDADPGRFQGKPEVPGNAVDEDCDGTAQPLPRLSSGIDYAFDKRPTGWVATRMRVTDLPAGGSVRLTCAPPRGRASGCPFRRVRATFPEARRRASVLRRLDGRVLAPGARLELRVRAPRTIGLFRAFRIRKGKVTVTKGCLRPGRDRPVKCPL